MEKSVGFHWRQSLDHENNNNMADESRENTSRPSVLSKCTKGLGKNRASFTPYPHPEVKPGLSGTVELLVTNLDQRMDHYEMKRIIGNLFREHVMVRNVSVFKQTDGSIAAAVTVNGRSEAQFAISRLHKIKVGHKRIFISYSNVSCGGSYSLCKEIVSLLKSVPNGKTHLFKFREMFEKRYHMSIPVSDLYKMRDVVSITEDSSGRIIQLKQNDAGVEDGFEASIPVESLYCSTHCPAEEQKGWAERMACPPLPNVNISLKELGPKIKLLAKNHGGCLPLASLARCYEAEFGQFQTTEGVPLEHLVACIKGVEITSGMTGIKRLLASSGEGSLSVASSPSFHSRPPSPPLVTQLLRLSREIVDLLKTYPGCRMPLSKFIPDYHHHFMRQLRVADYGFTKLRELFEELPNVVQLLGEGTRAYITLAHRAQVKRFTSDLLKVLKSQASKQLCLSEMSAAFEKCTGKPFRITDYGVCDVEDLLVEVSEHAIVVSNYRIVNRNNAEIEHDKEITEGGVIISIPKKEQTPEEMNQTRQFSQELLELLGHSPDCALPFNKFIPAYHHHFGRQCRVGDYGFSKLIEVFEALPEMVNITEDADGERLLQLVKNERLKVIGKQIVDVIEANQGKYLTMSQIPQAYTKKFGFQLRLDTFEVETIEELLSHLQSWVKVKEGREEPFVTIVDRGYIRTMAKNVQKMLMEHSDGKMELQDFVERFGFKFGSDIDTDMLSRDMSDIVTIVDDEYVQLTPLQMVARNIQSVLLQQNKKLSLEELQTEYFNLYGASINPTDHGFPNMEAMLAAIPETISFRGRGSRKLVSLSTVTRESIGKPSFSKLGRKPQCSTAKNPHVPSCTSTVSFSGRGFDMIRAVAPSRDANHNEVNLVPSNSMIRNSQLSAVPSYPKVAVPNPYSPHLDTTPRVPTSAFVSQPGVNVHGVIPSVIDYGTSAWGSSANRSPILGPTFHQHMMQHTLSPLIHQGSAYRSNPTYGSQFEASSFGAPPSTPACVPTGNQASLDLRYEVELEKNMEQLTESIANNVLLGTSPASASSRSVTPNSVNSPSSLIRSITPKRLVPQFAVPPQSPAYRREYAPGPLVAKIQETSLPPRQPFMAPLPGLNSTKVFGFCPQDFANSNS